jgi:hypothetical protein
MKTLMTEFTGIFAVPFTICLMAVSGHATEPSQSDFETAISTLSVTVAGATDGGDLPLLDTDRDGVPNVLDNCIDVFNTDQRDSNEDGYGNMCDADLDDSLYVDDVDLEIFRKAFFSGEPDADFNGDGVVNVIDLGIFRVLFSQPPGPSALHP